MARLRLSLACVQNYDRTGPLLEGTIKPSGIDFTPTAFSAPGELFRRTAQDAEFDVSEMSVSTFMLMRSHDDRRYVGLPIFPSRSFRHAYIFVNTSSGITEMSQLAGRRVGVTEYQQTAAVWLRGILKDDFGVRSEDVEWVTGGLDVYEPERFPVEIPSRFRIVPSGDNRPLDPLLNSGEIDALLGARAPACFRRGEPHIRRMFPNYREVEKDYFRRTGFFPIMHMVVVRRSIYEQHPWIAANLLDAFTQAKNAALARLWDTGSLAIGVPWLLDDMEEIRSLFPKGDPWPYGVESNRAMLEYMCDMSYDQGLSPRRLQLTDLFARETLDS